MIPAATRDLKPWGPILGLEDYARRLEVPIGEASWWAVNRGDALVRVRGPEGHPLVRGVPDLGRRDLVDDLITRTANPATIAVVLRGPCLELEEHRTARDFDPEADNWRATEARRRLPRRFHPRWGVFPEAAEDWTRRVDATMAALAGWWIRVCVGAHRGPPPHGPRWDGPFPTRAAALRASWGWFPAPAAGQRVFLAGQADPVTVAEVVDGEIRFTDGTRLGRGWEDPAYLVLPPLPVPPELC